MDIVIKCYYCGNQFIAKSSHAKWCSKKCKDIAFRTKHGISVNTNTEPFHKECVICGKSFDTFRDATITCSPECAAQRHKQMKSKPRSYEHTAEEWKQIRKIQAKQRAEQKEIEKAWIKAINTVERECVICGSLFYCLKAETKKTCSSECSKKWRNQKTDKRIPKEQIIDRDISIKRLYKRDKGKCWICGNDCDFNDYSFNEKGYKVYGNNYPEVEHVIPICRGGLHSWDNVRLSCHKCNHDKGISLFPYVPLDKEFAYKYKAKGNPPKKTAQYSLDGKLLKIWDSTGQIERETGLKSKHIQSVCRGYKSNTGNAYGFHWEYVS